MRIFFDLIGPQGPLYDFRGNHYDNPERAADTATLIACGLGSSDTDEWIGAQVTVRNVDGDTLFSVQIFEAA